MLGKVEKSIESLFDEMEPYARLFARLLAIWFVLKICRAIGMGSEFLDLIEHAEIKFAEFTFIILLVDSAMRFLVDRYTQWQQE
jgi:hypothetical protein